MDTKKILVPVDGSEPANRAFHIALDLAAKDKAEVTLIDVVDANDMLYATSKVMISPEFYTTIKRKGKELITKLEKEIPESIPHSTEIHVGLPGQMIASVAKEGHFDLIIMGNSGKGALDAFVTGSVSQYVIHHANCPVMIVK